MQKIGVFGGSFNPPHAGHRGLVEAALNKLGMGEIWVVPVGVAVHRELTSHISAKQRLAWVKTMFEDLPQVRVLDWEVCSDYPTPAIETMREVVSRVVEVPCWLMGMDAWQGLPGWVAYPEHREYCNVAVFSRQGEEMVQHHGWSEVKDAAQLQGAQGGHVYHVEVELPAISATQIRQNISEGKDVSMLLDSRIAGEIQAAYENKSSNGVNE